MYFYDLEKVDFTYFRGFQGFVHKKLSLALGTPSVLLVSLVATVAAVQRPLTSDAVRLRGVAVVPAHY